MPHEVHRMPKRYASNMHDTLQHRHELLCCPGIPVRAVCYDTVRHHILTYTSYDMPPSPSKNPLIPNPIMTEHSVRLYSLKREIKRRRLFQDDVAQFAPNAVKMQMMFSRATDVFVCVYTMLRDDVCGIEILEPATLDKLYLFRGGGANLIQCAALEDEKSDLLVCSEFPVVNNKQAFVYVIEVWGLARKSTATDKDSLSPIDVQPRPSLAPSKHQVTMFTASPNRVFGVVIPKPTEDSALDRDQQLTSLVAWDRGTRQIIKVQNGFDNAQRLTALQLSKCAQWLFSGHWNGSLNIWNVGYSLSRLYQIGPGGKPYKCLRGECLHVGGLTSILPQPKIDNDNSTEMEMDIFTTGKDACVQQHRFRTVLHGEGDIDVQFDKLGEFDPVARVGGKGKAPRVFCVPVAVEMGHFTEHLLLVAARDIVHVLKIQTLAESVLALQQNAHYSPLTFVHTAISQPISPPIAAALASDNTVTVLSLPSATSSQTVTPCLPSASISALIVHEHYIILGWSTGAVHVYDNLKFVGSAQDPTFTTSVTSIVVMNIPVWKARKPLAHESMWGGKLRSSKALAPLPRTNDAEAGTTCIFAASGDGFVLAWRLPSFQSAVVAEATVTWRGHSATIQSLLPFSIGENHHALVSIASNGLIKVWSVNPMADAAPPLLSQYAVPSRANGAVTATCLLEQDDHIHLFVCGFENGSIAIHQVDSHIQGARVWDMNWTLLAAADPHQRRVSCIRSVPHPGQLNPPSNIVMHCSFASASFDGHVIVWALDGVHQVLHERRYFEFHGPVLDAFVHDESLIVTLPNELCRVKYVSSLRAATFGEKPARHLHPITLPTETHGATAETAMANESRLQHIECHIAIHDRDKSLPEACPDSLSLAYPATQSPSDHDVMAEAIREFLASTHSEHQFDDEHAILLSATDLRRVYKIWRALSPATTAAFSGKRLAQFLSSNHLLPASKLTWAQAVDALTWCNTAPSTSSAAAVHRRYDAMGQTKRLVSFNSLGEKSVASVSVASARTAPQPCRPVASVPSHTVDPRVDVPTTLKRAIFLPRELQRFWRDDSCWCTGELVLPSQQAVDRDDPVRRPRCPTCRKRLHVVAPDSMLPVRSVLSTIHHVYKSAQLEKEHQQSWHNISLGPLTYALFKPKYGMPAVVEHKLEWFFISVAVYSPSYDAIRAFGQCCDIFHATPAVPPWLMHLYVDGYYWLQAHGLVTLGDPMPGAHHTYGVDVAHGEKHACWEMVSTDACRMCCQHLLVYPHVPPKFVANVLDASDAKAIRGNVEMHAFLVEWISEWEATSVAFARSERDLFGPRTMASMADELTKLRTLLECFIYYDRRRDGCVDHHTFGTIILGMLALWPPVDDACDVAEHIQGLVNRYQDHERDGAVCYLDMFSLLYVVALKAHKYLPFPDILDFSWGYKLELDDAYRGNVVAFMQNYMFQEPPAGVLDVGKLNGGSSQSWHRHSTGTFHWKHTVVAGPDAVDSALRMEHLAVHVGHPALRERAEQHDAKPSKHDVPPGPYIPDGVLPTNSHALDAALLRELIDTTVATTTATSPVPRRSVDNIAERPRSLETKPTIVGAKTFSTLYVQFPDTAPFKTMSTGSRTAQPVRRRAPRDNVSSIESVEVDGSPAHVHRAWQATTDGRALDVAAPGVESRRTGSTSFSNHVSIGTSRTLTSRDDPFVPTMDTVKSMDLAGAVADSQDDGSVGAQVLSCDVAPVGEVISPHLDKSDDVVTSGVAEAPSVGGFHPDSTRVDSDHDDDVQLVDVDAYIPADDLHTHAPQSATPLPCQAASSTDSSPRVPTGSRRNMAASLQAERQESMHVLQFALTDLHASDRGSASVQTGRSIPGPCTDSYRSPLATPGNSSPSSRVDNIPHNLELDSLIQVAAVVDPFLDAIVLPLPPSMLDCLTSPLQTCLGLGKACAAPVQLTRVYSIVEKHEVQPHAATSSSANPSHHGGRSDVATTELESIESDDEDGGTSDGESSDEEDDDGDVGETDINGVDTVEPTMISRDDASQHRPKSDAESTPSTETRATGTNAIEHTNIVDAQRHKARAQRPDMMAAPGKQPEVAPIVATSTEAIKRREFLFSYPVQLNVHDLYKARSRLHAPQWTPQDASDEEDDDAMTHVTTYDDSAFTDDGVIAAGDVCLSPRLDQNITSRWARVFESAELDIHTQLTDAFDAVQVDAAASSPRHGLANAEAAADASSAASIRWKTKRRTSIFRTDRATREACCHPTPLVLGESITDIVHSNQVRHYVYVNSIPDGIITFKLTCSNDAVDLFVACSTTAPCSTDCDWRDVDP
ncbi:hypothetical protein, variant 2 [Aphanomyces invadans]|uniref:Uncharacterized protein n=1 Tax=Aphanomyces invadans TaxID=157072 RepID=A0A024UK15_9STRA|nr:hypothetical protein, variant 1 [Aphanomyces invadans]XP_008864729.1 hypothetical protein, variant 2 [Aphanomyces invadans]ETW06653.1 hypothetical protein, variant 1 [Aphanomyces invadans]ETW06654.1 hypothetical protein, variant 2 [Aphanomyces invadans]|eukprot:XP_008864728.1 hypothetical protein, variant 1 [Aphanomyces invadans]